MEFNINIAIFLMLNICLMLAFAYYGSRLLNAQSLVDAAHTKLNGRFSGLYMALHVPRPVKRHSIPRIRVKSNPDDEPPHMPY